MKGLCFGILIVMYCPPDGPLIVSDFCAEAKTLIETPEYKPSRNSLLNDKRRYAALLKRYEAHCIEKDVK